MLSAVYRASRIRLRVRFLAALVAAAICLFAPALSGWVWAQEPTDDAELPTLSIDHFADSVRHELQAITGGRQLPSGRGLHWVLLLDTSQYQGTAPIAVAFQECIQRLWSAGLINDHSRVSIAAYQLELNENAVVWEQPIGRLEDILRHLPTTGFAQKHAGGHDTENAVRWALRRLSATRATPEAVIVSLSPKLISEPPMTQGGYVLVGSEDPELVRLLREGGYTKRVLPIGVPSPQKGRDVVMTVQARLYMPSTLPGVPPARRESVSPTLWVSLAGWLQRTLPVLGVLVLAAAAIWAFARPGPRPWPRPRPGRELMFIWGENEMNRSFPVCRRIFLYGHGRQTVLGDEERPTEISIEDTDTPSAALGYLVEIEASGREAARIKPALYSAEPDTVPYDKPTLVRLTPTSGVTTGFPITKSVTIRRS